MPAPAAVAVPFWELVAGTGLHRHPKADCAEHEQCVTEHNHLGGGQAHAHDEFGVQVPGDGGKWPHEELYVDLDLGAVAHRHVLHDDAQWLATKEHAHLGGGIPHDHDPQTGAQVPVGEPVLRWVSYDGESGEASLETEEPSMFGRQLSLSSAEFAEYERARIGWELWQWRLWGSKGDAEEWLTQRTSRLKGDDDDIVED